jgi:hypothetical protein
MRWVLRLIATGDDVFCGSTDLAEICRPDGLHDIANLGLTLLARRSSFWEASNERSLLDKRPAMGCSDQTANPAADDAT